MGSEQRLRAVIDQGPDSGTTGKLGDVLARGARRAARTATVMLMATTAPLLLGLGLLLYAADFAHLRRAYRERRREPREV